MSQNERTKRTLQNEPESSSSHFNANVHNVTSNDSHTDEGRSSKRSKTTETESDGMLSSKEMEELRSMAIGARQALLTKALAIRMRDIREIVYLESGENILDFHSNQNSPALIEALEAHHRAHPLDKPSQKDISVKTQPILEPSRKYPEGFRSKSSNGTPSLLKSTNGIKKEKEEVEVLIPDAVTSSIINSKSDIKSEEIAIRAAKDAEVLKRVSELQREGLWTAKRISKCHEPPRNKVHWDYLLAEMAWLANDFKEEKKRKIAMSKKVAKMTLKWHQDIISKEQKGVKEEELRMKRLAKTVANEIKKFWSQIEKVLNYKQKIKIDEQKRKEMDKHLDFLVGQTEKYSEMLAQDLASDAKIKEEENKTSEGKSEVSEMDTEKEEKVRVEEEKNRKEEEEQRKNREEKHKEMEKLLNEEGDEEGEEFECESEEDDETTITMDDENVQSKERPEGIDESEMLAKESEKPIDEIMKEYAQHSSEDEGDANDSLDHAANAAKEAQPTGFTLNTTTVKTKVPFLIRAQLREYQHIGLDWLVTMYHKKLNGILADEMGLGKTLMTISMLAHLACEKGVWGPHLIIVPTSLILNWELELKKWCPAFKVLTYYGSVKERKQKRIGWSKPNSFHVCITSYKLAIQDHAAFKKREWKYLILDEAHQIKNFKSQRWQVLLSFNSERRLLLTGTPLQNDLMELWSLMHFLMPHVFQSHSEFKDWFSNPVTSMIEGESDRNEEIIARLHGILRPFLLRRLKSQVEKQLPPKFNHVITCKLSKRQRFLYEEFMQQSTTRDTLSSGNFLGIVNVLMQLRKVCNHPDLFEVRPIVSSFDQDPILFWTSSLASSLKDSEEWNKESLISRLFKVHSEEESTNLNLRSFELKPTSSQFLEVFNNPPAASTILHPTNANSALEIFKAKLEEQRAKERLEFSQSRFNLNELRCGNQPCFGPNLISLLSINQRADIQRNPQNSDELFSYSEALESAILLTKQRVESLKPIIQNFTFCIPRARAPPPQFHCSHPVISSFQERERFDENLRLQLSESAEPFREQYIRTQIYFPDKRLIQYDCGKLQQLDLLLRQLKSGGHRCLIFTQMTRMLDVLEIFLNIHGHTYLRLDGSTKVERRQMLMERFNRDSKIFLFILSTRSGGIGVNLTGADTVIFYDSDWNPAMDAQAQDRCHRIGQTREVHIYRLISEYTIEENILKKSDQKRQLDDLVISGGSFTTDFFKKLDLRELIGDSNMKSTAGKVTEKDWVKAISSVEENTDQIALKSVQEEQATEGSEFGEEAPKEKKEEENGKEENNEDVVDADAELEDTIRRIESTEEEEVSFALEDQLTPIQRYMLRYLEGEKPLMLKTEEKIDEKDNEQELKKEEMKKEEDEMLYYEVTGRSIEVYIGSLHHSMRGEREKAQNISRIYGPPNPDLDELYIPPLDDCEWMGMYSSSFFPPPTPVSPPSMVPNSQFFSSSLLPNQISHFLNSSSTFASALEKQRMEENSKNAQNGIKMSTTSERALVEVDKMAAAYRRERLESFTAAAISASIASQEIGDEARPSKKKRKELPLEIHKSHKKKKDSIDEISLDLRLKKDKKKKKDKKDKKDKKNKKEKREFKSEKEFLEDRKNVKKKSEKNKKKTKKSEAESRLPIVEYVAPWTVDEDLSILETKKKFGPNFDLIASVINSLPRVVHRTRAKKHCFDRYKALIVVNPNEEVLIASLRENLEASKLSGLATCSNPRPLPFSIMEIVKKNATMMKKKATKNEAANSGPLPSSVPVLRSMRTPTDLAINKMQRAMAKSELNPNNPGAKMNPNNPGMVMNKAGMPVHLANSNRGGAAPHPVGKVPINQGGNKFSMDSTIGILGPNSTMDAATLARAMKNPASFKENAAHLQANSQGNLANPGTSVILNSNNSGQMSRLQQINQSMTTGTSPHGRPNISGLPPNAAEISSVQNAGKMLGSPTKSNPGSVGMGPGGAGRGGALSQPPSASNVKRPQKVKQSAPLVIPPTVPMNPNMNPNPLQNSGGIPNPALGLKPNPKKSQVPVKNSGNIGNTPVVIGTKASGNPKAAPNPNFKGNGNQIPITSSNQVPMQMNQGVVPGVGLPALPSQSSSGSPLSTLLVLYSMNHLSTATTPCQEVIRRKDLTEPQKVEELQRIIKEHAQRRSSTFSMNQGL